MTADDPRPPDAEHAIAMAFHNEYERQAEANGWATQERSRVPWNEVPLENRLTMIATVRALLESGVIRDGR